LEVVRAEEVEEEGLGMIWSGLAKRASTWEAVWERGERARFFRGRLKRGSAEVGMLSGMGSDIVVVTLRRMIL
jgi:hypothetical protein